ncbi:MAG: (2Fe-2S) ferredoxin domain-containing protein [Erysipelotrichaceae bacterium]|nr:(2Fe-2S) ferredoxin domain-containing protein [Erysipelotrichaceae bacterium]
MKSLAELEKIQIESLKKVNLRTEKRGTRIVVGMDTCGLAAGARPVMLALLDEIMKRNLHDVEVVLTGCIGICSLEPMIEVYIAGEPKVTYVDLTEEKARRIVAEHIVNHQIVYDFIIGTYEE